MAGPRVINFI